MKEYFKDQIEDGNTNFPYWIIRPTTKSEKEKMPELNLPEYTMELRVHKTGADTLEDIEGLNYLRHHGVVPVFVCNELSIDALNAVMGDSLSNLFRQ